MTVQSAPVRLPLPHTKDKMQLKKKSLFIPRPCCSHPLLGVSAPPKLYTDLRHFLWMCYHYLYSRTIALRRFSGMV